MLEKDIPIADMDAEHNILISCDGRRFHEVNTNVWMTKKSNAAYLGTARHGGGIVLRLLFVEKDGEWVNATTGRISPFDPKEFKV